MVPPGQDPDETEMESSHVTTLTQKHPATVPEDTNTAATVPEDANTVEGAAITDAKKEDGVELERVVSNHAATPPPGHSATEPEGQDVNTAGDNMGDTEETEL